jgi:hypothetical protein
LAISLSTLDRFTLHDGPPGIAVSAIPAIR